MSKPLQELNAEIFRQHLHSKFKVPLEGQEPILLELVAVEEPPHAPGMELFSLQFAGPFLPRLVQRTHRLEHEKLGDLDIFLTALSAEPNEGTRYESIFHRFLDKQK